MFSRLITADSVFFIDRLSIKENEMKGTSLLVLIFSQCNFQFNLTSPIIHLYEYAHLGRVRVLRAARPRALCILKLMLSHWPNQVYLFH